jgi:hypothetical protein
MDWVRGILRDRRDAASFDMGLGDRNEGLGSKNQPSNWDSCIRYDPQANQIPSTSHETNKK